jgi:hypothetical protein
MGKPFKSHETFIRQLKDIYGERYDLTFVNYIHARSKVKLICSKHGEFFKTPNKLLSGQGCKLCSNEIKRLKKRLTKETFISKSNKKHGDRYDYSKVVMRGTHKHVAIICKIHGEFLQTPASHQRGRGCPSCYHENIRGASQRRTQEEFIRLAKERHGNKYDYSKVVYKNSITKVVIICPTHGEFSQFANSHLKYGCQLCANKAINQSLKMTTAEFVEKSINVHGHRYDYNKTVYNENQDTNVEIICKKHGVFLQRPTTHLRGCGCPKCKSSAGENKIRIWLDAHNLVYEEQKSFKDCRYKRPLRFDFYFPTLNVIVEFDGPQHFPESEDPKTYRVKITNRQSIQIRDEIKNEWCRRNSIKMCRIKYTDDIENALNGIFGANR